MLKKYLGLISITTFLFVNFIACGSQMYKVSVEDDHDKSSIPEAAANPESNAFGIHAIAGWQELPVKFRIGKKLTHAQELGLIKAMKTWETSVGRKLFEYIGHDEKDGDSFKDLYSSLADHINGHYMDFNWKKTGKPEIVLATTIWDNSAPGTIGTADIRFNSFNYKIQDSMSGEVDMDSKDAREIVDMETLALHELGHLLGLAHIPEEYDPYSIMNPSLYIGEGLSNRKVSRGDIERIQRIYNCEGDSCDIDGLILAFERNDQKSLESQSIAEENNSDDKSDTSEEESNETTTGH